MTRRPTGGGGVVANWTVEAVADRAGQRLMSLQVREEERWESVSLVEDALATVWPARDQGHRSTCNAFAVVAAEELWQWRETGQLAPLSEELLYRDMRATPPPPETSPHLIAPNCSGRTHLDLSGTTFLAQAKAVLTATGLYPASAGPYEKGAGLPRNHVTRKAPTLGAIPPHGSWTHNIAVDGDILNGVDWSVGGVMPAEALSTLFHSALRKGVPVVASFALPEGVGIEAFIGPEGRTSGKVRYPPVQALLRRNARPVAGHTVCIVGFQAAAEGPGITSHALKGHFMFRNSLGTIRQAGGKTGFPSESAPVRPGYGLISVPDLETWCWEFLYRADTPSSFT